MLPYVRQHNWVFLIDGTGWPTYNAYRQNGYIPLNYVIDRHGTVRYWGEGFDEQAVRNAIEAWLGVEAGGSEKPAAKDPSLAQNRPNPFSLSTDITFSLPNSQNVRLAVYDAQGRLVRNLLEETRSAGTHHVSVSGLKCGVYFYRLVAGKTSLTRRMVVTK